VHRDLKPANIWLTPDARSGFHVTLLDFGIAKLRDDTFARREPDAALPVERESATNRATSGTATQVGESIGTPAYMSPEQCVGDGVDLRSDVYSLGVVVYQMFAGALPFRGDTRALLRQHFVAEIPPLPADAGVPAEVEAVLRRALAKEPETRFQSAPSFAAALRAHASGFGESMRRALGVFAERMPELSMLGVCFALPGVVAAAIGACVMLLPWYAQPLLWMIVLLVPMLLATPLAMASIATVFGDLRERPFVTIRWRDVARAVVGPTGAALDGAALYVAWLRTALTRYVAVGRTTKGNAVRNMLAYVDLYRHGGTLTPPERLAEMERVLPTRAFATMAIAQFGALLALVGVLAFSVALFLQVFIALVDVMLYDLAYDMTEA
jgi:hypothetical protein